MATHGAAALGDHDLPFNTELAAGSALKAHDKVDLVYGHNDPMAYGAYLADLGVHSVWASSLYLHGDCTGLGLRTLPAEYRFSNKCQLCLQCQYLHRSVRAIGPPHPES